MLHSMVLLHDKKKIDFVSLHPSAMHSWLMTVEQSKHSKQVTTEVFGNVAESPFVQVESSCSSRSGGPVDKLRKKDTDLD